MDAAQEELRDFTYPLNDFLEVSGQMILFRRSTLERCRMEKLAEEFSGNAYALAASGQAETWSPSGSSENATSIRAARESPRVNPRCPRVLEKIPQGEG